MKKDYAYGIIPFYEDQEIRYLIAQRSGPDGFWKFPKGHKESGETGVQAALRETAEELGVDIHESDVINDRSFQETYTYTGESSPVQKINTYWLAPVKNTSVVTLNDEFTQHKLVSFKQALRLLSENSRDFFTEAHIYLQQVD